MRQGNWVSVLGREKKDSCDFRSTVDRKPPVVIEYVMKTVTRKMRRDATDLPIIFCCGNLRMDVHIHAEDFAIRVQQSCDCC